jgi:selenocysteine-specific elongation factor
MARHVVIGTAGHVDHGKTALVQALTGIDTDRWEEEKRRGITIDLGFAHFRLSDDTTASVVDVPGHEDFIRNMVAGATGIDVALLVIAADEGVMPQTVEHLAILEFLGVRVGAVAVTKVDLVEAEWLDLVVDDLGDRLAQGDIAWEAPIPTSVRSGQGMEEIRGALLAAAGKAAERTAGDLFRMPIDRAFSVAGAGTVVTGTTWAGTVGTGEDVRILPAGIKSRVRGVEVHGESASQAEPGKRTAVALVGVGREDAGRGSTVVRDPAWRASRAIDVSVRLLPDARPLSQRSRIRVHVGTAEVMARLTPAAGDILPGGSGVVRLRLESPLVCRWGDRGVLRSYSPVTTVGGFVVVDPWPSAAAFVHSEDPGAVSVEDLTIRLGLPPELVQDVLTQVEAQGVTVVAGRLHPGEAVARGREAALAAVERFQAEHPLQPGMPMEVFRREVGSPAMADHVRTLLESEGAIEVVGGSVRLPGFYPTLTGSHADYGVVVEEKLAAAGAQGVTLAEMAADLPADMATELAGFFVRRGTAVRVGTDRYYDQAVLIKVSRRAVAEIEQRGEVTPADLRDALGLSRKYLIPLLEWLDARQITVRVGDTRRLGPNAHQEE